MSRAKVFIPESYNNAERYYKTKNNIYASYDDWRHDTFYHMPLVIDKKYETREDGTYGFDCKFPVYHEKNADFFWMYRGDSFMEENLNSDSDFRVEFWTTNEKECISFRDYLVNNDTWETDGTCYSYSETVIKKENKIEKKLITCEIVNDDQSKYLDFYKTMDVCIGFFDSHSSKFSRSITIRGTSTAAAIKRITPLLELNNDDAWEAIMEELKNYKSQEIDVRTTVVSVSVGDLLNQMPYVKYLYIYDESGNLNIQSVHDDIEEYVNIVVDDWSYSSGILRISL